MQMYLDYLDSSRNFCNKYSSSDGSWNYKSMTQHNAMAKEEKKKNNKKKKEIDAY